MEANESSVGVGIRHETHGAVAGEMPQATEAMSERALLAFLQSQEKRSSIRCSGCLGLHRASVHRSFYLVRSWIPILLEQILLAQRLSV